MPARKKPTLVVKEIRGALALTNTALGDIQVILDLWNTNQSSSHGRLLIRTFVVGLEAYYSSALYKIELCRLYLKKTGRPEGRKTEYIDLDFSSAEIDFIYDSRSNSLNARRLKGLIKLIEKTFLISNFDFGSGDTWSSIRDLFEKRNGFTHPRNIDDLSTDDIQYLITNGLIPILKHIKFLDLASTKGFTRLHDDFESMLAKTVNDQ